MTRKFAALLAAATLILAGSALAQQPPAEPQAPVRGQPGMMGPRMMGPGMMGPGMMGPGMMCPGMMGHGDWAPWMTGPGRHHGMMMAPGMIQAFAEGKLAFLKSWLGITEAQSGPWNAFADVVLAEAQQKRMPPPGQPELTLPQSVDLDLQMMEEHRR
jgi:hypothetical protein